MVVKVITSTMAEASAFSAPTLGTQQISMDVESVSVACRDESVAGGSNGVKMAGKTGGKDVGSGVSKRQDDDSTLRLDNGDGTAAVYGNIDDEIDSLLSKLQASKKSTVAASERSFRDDVGDDRGVETEESTEGSSEGDIDHSGGNVDDQLNALLDRLAAAKKQSNNQDVSMSSDTMNLSSAPSNVVINDEVTLHSSSSAGTITQEEEEEEGVDAEDKEEKEMIKELFYFDLDHTLADCIGVYTSNKFKEINKALRDEKKLNKPMQDEMVKLVKGITAGLEALQTYNVPGGKFLYRGADGQAVRQYHDLEPGKMFCDAGFLSTSRKKAKAMQFVMEDDDILFVISNVQKGKYIAPYSHMKYEEEVLFPPGTDFLITKVEGDTVWMTEVAETSTPVDDDRGSLSDNGVAIDDGEKLDDNEESISELASSIINDDTLSDCIPDDSIDLGENEMKAIGRYTGLLFLEMNTNKNLREELDEEHSIPESWNEMKDLIHGLVDDGQDIGTVDEAVPESSSILSPADDGRPAERASTPAPAPSFELCPMDDGHGSLWVNGQRRCARHQDPIGSIFHGGLRRSARLMRK